MLVILLGIMIDVKPLQLLNACEPIFVTVLGIAIVANFLQPSNAQGPISVTEPGIVYDVSVFPEG